MQKRAWWSGLRVRERPDYLRCSNLFLGTPGTSPLVHNRIWLFDDPICWVGMDMSPFPISGGWDRGMVPLYNDRTEQRKRSAEQRAMPWLVDGWQSLQLVCRVQKNICFERRHKSRRILMICTSPQQEQPGQGACLSLCYSLSCSARLARRQLQASTNPPAAHSRVMLFR